MKKFIGRFGLVLMATLAAAVLFEGYLRINTPIPENLAKLRSSSLFLHENKPGARFPYIGAEFRTDVSINAYGFRDDEFKIEKEPGVLRIAVLGDSQEEALQVLLEDTWQKVMARKLSEELGKAAGPGGPLARRVESYNFGVSGYGTDQEWLTLREKVWQFAPDMVILAFSPNDVGDTYKNKLVKVEGEKLKVSNPRDRMGGNWLGKQARETYIYHLIIRASSNELAKKVVDKIREKILGFPKEERFFLSDAQLVEGPFEVIASQKSAPKEVLDSWSLIKVILADMKRQANEHGAKFLITINIPKAQVLPSDWEHLQKTYKLDPARSSPFEINEVLSQIAKELEIDFYDGRADVLQWKNQNGDLHFSIDAHYNKNGHLFMGTKVADFIIEKELIED